MIHLPTLTIPLQSGTKLLRVYHNRVGRNWRLWTHTADYIHGTFLELHDDGAVYRVTVGRDGFEDAFLVQPPTEGEAR